MERPPLFVVRPHLDDLNRLLLFEYLIDEPMLYVDSPGAGTGEISHEFFEGGRTLVRIFAKDVQQPGGCGLEAGSSYSLCVFLGLFGENQTPAHQPGSSAHLSTGVFMPFWMDSRIPGIDVR